MTPAPDPKRAEPWMKKALGLAESRIEDARAHAEKAITGRVKDAADGRQTWRLATAGRSFKAALSRLRELTDALCGPAKTSLDGLVRDARAAFYRDSWAAWHPEIPAEYRASDSETPPKANLAAIRGATSHGYDLRSELAPAIEQAARTLQAAVTAAGGSGVSDAHAQAMLSAWETRAKATITQRIAAVISDSDVGAHYLAGLHLIHPDHRPEID